MNNNSAKTLFDNKTYIFMTECLSTNDYLLKLLKKKNYEEGTMVHTNYQKNGRGQRNNEWLSENGKNLTFSFLLEPYVELSNQFFLHIITSISIFKTLLKINIKCLSIKWPNDIYVNDKKIAGILIENLVYRKFIHKSVIGVGLNINQANFGSLNATSIINETLKKHSLDQILKIFKSTFNKEYLKLNSNKIHEEFDFYKKNLIGYQVEKKYEYNSDIIKGKIIDILSDGILVIQTKNSIMKLNFGDIRLV
ncbi:MAG: biotin--[acetyl-CoA-carboxylase] ligase [Bacteroidota bacterium]|nr:biotin--[acetyl-CoA-carboxylase] ligase [Bacteroidota bacterium]